MQTNTQPIQGKRQTMRRHGALAIAALTLSIASAHAQAVFDQPAIDFKGQVFSAGVVHPGGEATVNGSGFAPGQEVRLVNNGKTVSKDDVLVADQEGKFATTIAVPADAATGRHSVVVQAAKPSAASIFTLKISPKLAFSGADKFTIQSAHLVPGLYQSAYSAASKALFVTSAVGRPPVTQSALAKVNPNTLKIEASITPPPDKSNDKGQVQAVYGVAVDDAAGTVWVTNTRTSTVAVYKQSDLSLVKQFDNGQVDHARDIVVDSKHHRAYASATGSNQIIVLDTQKLQPVGAIEIQSGSREKFTPMSLALDADNGKLYTVSISTNEAAVIDLKKQQVEHVYPVKGASSASGVAVAPQQQVLFVASQGSDTVHLLNLKDGSILHTVSVGAGPLNVQWDPKAKLAYVASRNSGSVAVIDLEGKLVANLEGGTYPNHVSTDGNGTLFVLNKSQGKDDKTGDRVSRIVLK